MPGSQITFLGKPLKFNRVDPVESLLCGILCYIQEVCKTKLPLESNE
jgi:hypothetical protein